MTSLHLVHNFASHDLASGFVRLRLLCYTLLLASLVLPQRLGYPRF